ncbi:MAG: protein-L-isoaspartate O-methyltransferase [Candidatus Bathyarchaeia archaeon]
MSGSRDFVAMRQRAVEALIDEGILRHANVIAAMMKVPREEFLPPEARSQAYVDSPISIGFGQTTSALHMTAMFCEYGELKLGQRVLEVGGGCGYMSAVYAEIVASIVEPKDRWGHVWSAEIIPELAEVGKKNIERLGFSERVTFECKDASGGFEGEGQFDVIIVTSAAPTVPSALIKQLNVEGTLVIPVGEPQIYQELLRIKRKFDGTLSHESLGGVAFVPMRGKYGWAK